MNKEFLSKQIAIYDLLREVFFNSLKEEDIDILHQKISPLAKEYQQTPFIQKLQSLSGDELDNARWDFNRLFIGPAKPLASTFESVHLTDKNLMMQNQTFEVRKYYNDIGIKVENQNHFPDDFIGFEYQYLYCLSILSLESKELDKMLLVRKDFIQNHPNKWFPLFAGDINKYAKEQIWKDLASLISLVSEEENRFLNLS